MAAYVIIRLAMSLIKKRNAKSILAFLGIAIIALFSINEVLMRYNIYLLEANSLAFRRG